MTCRALSPLQLFKCLAEETRLQAVALIYQAEELCVCDLCEVLGVSQPKMSRHLKELKNCQIVDADRRGKWVYYRLHPQLPPWSLQLIADTSQTLLRDFDLPQLPTDCKGGACCD